MTYIFFKSEKQLLWKKEKENWRKEMEKNEKEKKIFVYIKWKFIFSQISGIRPNQYLVQPYFHFSKDIDPRYLSQIIITYANRVWTLG